MEPVRSAAGRPGGNDALPPPGAAASGESSLPPPTPVKSSMEGGNESAGGGASVLVPGNISVHAINQHQQQQNGGAAHLKNCGDSGARIHTKRKLDDSTTLQVSPDELDWLYLFRQRPGPKDSKEAWLRRLEKVAGFSIKGEQARKVPRQQGSEDAASVLPEIEAPVEGLANFDAENLEDLFE